MSSMVLNDNASSTVATTGGLDRSTALAIGFGLHVAWTCTAMYSTRDTFGTLYEFLGVHGGSLSLLYFASVIAFGLTALVLATADQKAIRYSRSRAVMGAFAVVTCVGTLIALLSPLVPALALPLECLSGVVTGVGSVVLMLYWATALSREKKTTIAACASIGVALGFSLNTMLLQSIPAPGGGLCTAAIPLLEFFILRDITPLPVEQGGPAVPFNPLPANKLRFSMRFVAPMAFIGFALGILKHISVQMTLGSSTAEGIVILMMAAAMTVLLFVLYCLVPRLRDDDSFLRIVVPALACIALALSLATESNTTLNSLFLLVAYIIAESLTWVVLAGIAHSTHLSPVFLFGISRGVITLAMLAGTMLPAFVLPEELMTAALPPAICIVLIALGFAVMPQSTHVLAMVAQCPLVRIVSLELDEGVTVLPTLQTAERAEEKSTADTAGSANAFTGAPADETTTSAVSAGETTDADQGASLSAGAQEPVSATAPATPAVPAASAAPAPAVPAVSEARLAMEAHPQAGESDREGKKHVGQFSRKVKLIAQTYLLTERETDILFELAKGNSPASIQDKFYISAGTVKTHIRNIYRKLDVHKRQELLNLVEEFDAYDK